MRSRGRGGDEDEEVPRAGGGRAPRGDEAGDFQRRGEEHRG
jgi:hypothetical protein